MIVSELVLHHAYTRGVAFDLSGKGNHGFLQGVGMVGGNAVFGGGSDAIRVKVSPTLKDLRAIRVQVTFKISFATPVSHRSFSGWRCCSSSRRCCHRWCIAPISSMAGRMAFSRSGRSTVPARRFRVCCPR